MKRPWPATLFGRVALIVCGGLALAHVLTFWIILRERGDAGQTMMRAYFGRDVAAAVAILDRVPPAERPAWLPRLARQTYAYRLTDAPPADPTGPEVQWMGTAVADVVGPARVGPVGRSREGTLVLPLRLQDGAPLWLELTPRQVIVSRTTIVLLGLQFLSLALAAWWAVRMAVKPLGRLAAAADALMPGATAADLDDGHGPREVTQAARAFDAMQRRIDSHLAERLQLLAAISHDLQSPITRMTLRTERVPDEALRAQLHADLAAMQSLVEEGLAYARTAHASREPPCAVDVHALLDGIVCNAVDAGHRVTFRGESPLTLVTRVQALRRVVTNLLDNAIKFGGDGEAAEVAVMRRDDTIEISVRDRGPGIPAAELGAVMQPFYRVEGSRNRDTGGTGLGLAIAQQLAGVLGGELVLSNREGGGLEARLVLITAQDRA